jgi:hypothetical protein
MWLDAKERRYVEESGVMNVFFIFRGHVVTPALSGTILPGITRDSVMTLLRNMGYRVMEERISIDDVFRGMSAGSFWNASERERRPLYLTCGAFGTRIELSNFRLSKSAKLDLWYGKSCSRS